MTALRVEARIAASCGGSGTQFIDVCRGLDPTQSCVQGVSKLFATNKREGPDPACQRLAGFSFSPGFSFSSRFVLPRAANSLADPTHMNGLGLCLLHALFARRSHVPYKRYSGGVDLIPCMADPASKPAEECVGVREFTFTFAFSNRSRRP